jgi:carbamoyl-phosphate synthase large subunit
MRGQTALNCALDLDKHGVLEKYAVEMIGANKDAINMAEDRDLFNQAMGRLGFEVAKSKTAQTMQEAFAAQAEVGYPTVIRPSFTMGGSGGGIAYNKEEFVEICTRGLYLSPTNELLVEESVLGWKEYEMEVVRDTKDNCIIICSIENFDPMGVHTGDSITVAPAQTLTDKEYQILRNVSLAILREIGIDTGGSNVQVAINPKDGRMVIIEMNPRVSRSSALASKATGFPIAKVAAKLAIGYTLDELQNEITSGVTPASFEPTIDYVVTKVPRFTFEKFPKADDRLTTQMKSVGEVMAIGRTFQESLQKALRSLEIGVSGLDEIVDLTNPSAAEKIQREMRHPGPERLWYVADAFRSGMSFDDIHKASKIDPWFLAQLEDLVLTEKSLANKILATLKKGELFRLKQKGFSDARLAKLLNTKESTVRKVRYEQDIRPVYKRIDSCAAEFSSETAYLYSTYEQECEARVSDKEKIIILGGGPNRIGQGIEFDYCCVHAALALREEGYETIMINCNPETVSTDYDTSDRLYFEGLTFEDVLEIIHLEKPKGVIVQYGGQTPLKLARDLEAAGVPIIGTSPDAIDLAEDRERFQSLIDKLELKQPPNGTACSIEQAIAVAKELSYPLVVRPSYVLGGRGMEIVYDDENLQRYMKEAISVSNGAPVLLDRFLDDAIEMDVDAIYDGETVLIGGLMQHVEQAGVHSGDSACSIPPYDLPKHLQDELRVQVAKMAEALGVCGLMNTQFAIQGETIYVLEVNPRASRTAPFVSKATGYPLAKIAALCMVGKSLKEQGIVEERVPEYFSVKESVFPFVKFPGVDPLLGPEMKSTGEVMGVGKTFSEAFAKSQRAASVNLSASGTALISIRDADKPKLVEISEILMNSHYKIVATKGTAKVLQNANIACDVVYKVNEGRPNTVDMIKNDEIQLIINTTEGVKAVADSFTMRREALQHHVPYYTTMAGAKAACYALGALGVGDVNSLQNLHKSLV